MIKFWRNAIPVGEGGFAMAAFGSLNYRWRNVRMRSLGNTRMVLLVLLLGHVLPGYGSFIPTSFAQPAIRTPDYPALQRDVESGVKGTPAAGRLAEAVERPAGDQLEGIKNKYRGGSPDNIKDNMEKLLAPILLGVGGDSGEIDKWYSPHLRDATYPEGARKALLKFRALARTESLYGPMCKLPALFFIPRVSACRGPRCWWFDDHDRDPIVERECCQARPSTTPYALFGSDANFKICCVRNGEQDWQTEAIACKHPRGDGWAGLFEYYYPTTVFGLENDRTTTMIASKQEVEKCKVRVPNTGSQDWVKKAIERNVETLNSSDKSADPIDSRKLSENINKDINEVRPRDKKLRSSDSLQGEGLTVRVNLPAMDPEYRRKLARHFCMHPDQFMKLMDNEQDPIQRRYPGSLEKGVPIWSNYCPEGARLMTDPDESANLNNADGTDTDLTKGYQAWKTDPLFCQRMNFSQGGAPAGSADREDRDFMAAVLEKLPQQGRPLSEADVGYTCRQGGKLNGSMSPVEMYRHAAIERRTAFADHALGFLIAGGVYKNGMLAGNRSYYKRFEPRPYSRKFGMFAGRPFRGSGSGPSNENFLPCKALIQGEDYNSGEQNRSDRLFISDYTHKDVFTKEKINAPDPSGKEFNRSVEEWAQQGQESKQQGQESKIANRGLDKDSSNYGAAFRIFATCPKGYVRWRPKDIHVEGIDKFCGEENLGGDHPKIVRYPN